MVVSKGLHVMARERLAIDMVDIAGGHLGAMSRPAEFVARIEEEYLMS